MSGTMPNEIQNSEENEEDEEEDEEDDDSGRPRENEESTEDEVRSGSIMTRGLYGALPSSASNSVKVAVRIRPLLPREVIANARECITVTPGEPQVFMGSHAYTYDFVFKPDAPQDEIFEKCAKPLVDGILEGYNATILAYGQTGSGKTYTMGTGFDPEVTNSATLVSTPTSLGILPRCISYLFERIRELTIQISPPPDFKVSVQFTELYNEEVIDLLSDSPIMQSSRPATATKSNIKIHEDSSGQIYLVNLATKSVSSCSDTLETLKTGALNRTTASTNMNDSSSRSHAIFTIMVNQTRVVVDKSGASDIESLHAKFHFVDLAGSERLKRTLATGDRAKEGIAINSGLLVLGNVISALGDKSKKATHVPYRDSKLTRLLQDSLGGNSRTLMIACVSPNEMDFVESINTMKYANRAKNIKNKVVINQDKSSRTIALLKDRINELETELMEYKRGSRKPEHELELDVNAENIMLLAEVETLKSKLKSKQDTIDKLLSQIARLQAVTITDDPSCDLTNLVSKYLHEIEDLRAKLYESESECEKLRSKQRQIIKNLASPRESGGMMGNVSMSVSINEDVSVLLSKAKEEVSEQKHVVEVKSKVAKSEDEESSEDEDDSSSSERDGNANNYTELANLNQEISTKQRLIEELENSQLRMESMKTKYEEKLGQLFHKIKATEEERDAVMKKKTGSAAKEKNLEYEVKIREYQAELKRWNSAKKEHAKLLRNQSSYEAQIDKYRREIEEMKKMKVKLIHQVKNENLRHREVEKQRAREITQLKKETRKQEFRVRKLESDSKLKDAVLKRKLQEVEMLKKNRFNSKVKNASPVKGKQAWSRIQNSMKKEANSRCSVASLEKDMVGLIQRRSELNGMLSNETDVDVLDSIQSNLALVEEKIKGIQEEIVCSNDRGEEKDSARRSVVVEHLSTVDYSYVVEKLFEHNVESMSCVGMLEGRVSETEEVNKHLQREVDTLRDLLHHLYMRKSSPEAENEQQRRIEHMLMPPPALPGMSAPQPPPSAPKARRRLTATTQELLGSMESLELLSDQQPPTNHNNRFTRNTRLTQSMRSSSAGGNASNPINRNKTKPILTRQDTYSVIDSNVLNNTYVIEGTNEPEINNTNKTALQRSVSEISDVERTTRSIRGPGNIRSPRGNAWLSLSSFLEGHTKPVLCLSSTNEYVVSGSKDATCRVWNLETSKEVACYEGHPHNVACVCHVPESNLIMTGSSYQIKIFDTRTNQPVKSFSSSGGECIGQLQSQPPIPSLHSATLPRVNDLPSGEKQVHSIQAVRNYFFTSFGERIRIWDIRKLQPLGTLYGKHNSSVMCITGCESGLHGRDWMITGSKDHSIKVYEYNPNTPPDQINCVKNLNPPHYDGIECLLLGNKRNGTLYSGSRDMCIKKWDLENSKIVGTVNMAHSGWITGLANLPSSQTDHEYVISSSRDGTLKIWDSSREFKEIARFENNLGLECVNTNDKYVFFGGTGAGNNAIGNSVDGVIGVFKLSETWSKNLFCNNNNVLPSNVTTRSGSGGSTNSNNPVRQTQYLGENV